MKKNFFDKMSDSYDQFHLEASEWTVGNETISISPKIKLALGWSLFVLCCVIAVIVLGNPFAKNTSISLEDKKAVLDEEVDVNEEHDTIIPYEKDADSELNAFIEEYFKAITSCDNLALQDMVTNPEEYNSDETLKRKAEYITGYNNITVYTKEGLDEGSYIAFVVANISIAGVNSSPYDIVTLYIVNGARGYLINNGELSKDMQAYIEKVKGDKDIQKIYRSIEKKNAELKEKDASLQEFYEIISRKNVEVNSVADQMTTEEASTEQQQEETESQSADESQQTEQSEEVENQETNDASQETAGDGE